MSGIRYVVVFLFFILVGMPSILSAASGIPVYELSVTINPEEHLVTGKARITVPANIKPYLKTGDLKIKKLIINDVEYTPEEHSINSVRVGSGEKTIEIDYSALFKPHGVQTDARIMDETGTNVIDPSGIMLLSNWYPALNGLARYKLIVEIPPGYEIISEADSSEETEENFLKRVTFDFPHPSPGITLVAGKYNVYEDTYGNVTIRTLLIQDDQALAKQYLEKTKEYIMLYESLIGAFPYPRFSIVENTFQTGYSFPTYTLLGSQVIRLPFIIETSLGHEVLHQWFGNHVYVDHASGNWSEGLTTYLSDHWFDNMRGDGAVHRKKMLMDYMNYVSSENEISLREFTGREDFATKAIGYGKSAMVFHMLRKRLGDDLFFSRLRTFVETFAYRNAAWDDLAMSFNPTDAEDLDQFFSQWLERKDIPSLDVTNIQLVFRNGKYILTGDISQKGEPYSVHLQGKAVTAEAEEKFTVEINRKEVHFEESFEERPLKIVFDQDYDMIRALQPPEKPPVISAFTGSKKSVAITPENDMEIYGDVAELLKEQGYTVKHEKEVTNQELINNSILILSGNNGIYRRLFAGRTPWEGGLVINTENNPLNPDHAAVVVSAINKEELRAFNKMFRYGNYSLLIFQDGSNVRKETAGSNLGIVIDIGIEPEAVETNTVRGLNDVIEKIRDTRVIFVGEIHNRYAHHVMQYEIIKRLHELNGNLVIGMEMFQRPFQEYLDKYINGEIAESEFLKKTEYFDRWKFDYNLYRDILHYARHSRIPVIALNLRKEIVEKVSKEGIDALSEEEQNEIPADIDMTNLEYRENMKAVFQMHKGHGNKSFDNFFQSQILWDETMAHNTVAALRQNPDAQMVVIAGNGHIQYAWGIPDRVRRLSGESTAIILNSEGNMITRDLADFVLYPSPLEAPESPKLGVILKDGAGYVEIEKPIPGTPADRADLRKGDMIIAIDDTSIEDISDLKVTLIDRKPGDAIKITIKRQRFLFGPKDMEIQLTL